MRLSTRCLLRILTWPNKSWTRSNRAGESSAGNRGRERFSTWLSTSAKHGYAHSGKCGVLSEMPSLLVRMKHGGVRRRVRLWTHNGRNRWGRGLRALLKPWKRELQCEHRNPRQRLLVRAWNDRTHRSEERRG